jgi:RNA polymerase sigma-70 factor, ECF subfamily
MATAEAPALPLRSEATRRRFAALVLECRVALIAHLMHCGADLATAEDCVQEALVRAYGALDELESFETARGWLFGIARNVFLSDARRRAVVRRHEPVLRDASETATAPVAERAVEAAQTAQALADAIERLEPPKPEILQLHYGAGLRVAEIARALDMPEATVKTHLRRARIALHDRLLREGVGHE